MKETIACALLIYRTHPDFEDYDIFIHLVEEGVDRNIAARLVEFIPCVYVRILFAKSGVVLSNFFQRMDKNANKLPEQLLTSVPLWNEIVTYAQSELQTGIPQEDIVIIASRSAEYNAISDLIKKGAKLNGIRTTPLLFGWPEDGPEDNENIARQNDSPKKQWWQFWK
jgi:hypothetical protein